MGQASQSVNGYLFSGELEGWRAPKLLRAMTNPAARYAYRIPIISETQAQAYLLFLAQPNAGDTVTIGDDTYAWVDTLEPDTDTQPLTYGLPGQVVIGGSVSLSIANLLAAITTDNGTSANAGVLYGAGTLPNGDVLYYQDGLPPQPGLPAPFIGIVQIASQNYDFLQIGAPDFGSQFNLTVVSESSGNLRTTWLRDLLGLSDTTTTFAGGTNPTSSNDITGPSTWLEFLDQDTNVVKSQVVNDEFNRFYFASPSQPPMYNTYDRITAGQPPWWLGVPPPGCAPTLSVTGGGNNLTLGNYTAGNGEYFGSANFCYLTPITPPGATDLLNVTFNTAVANGDNTGANFVAVVYEDNNGLPGALLGVGDIQTGITSSTTNQSSFTNTISLAANDQYWIGIVIDTAINFNIGPNGVANTAAFPTTFTNGPDSTAPAASGYPQQALNMWANLSSSDLIEARSYVYTWVSAYNEEGPPSPPSLLNGWSNGIWTVGLWTPPPNDLGVLRNLTTLNIYRAITGTGGSTVYYFVANVPIGTASYVDSIPDSTIALNNQLPSTNWFPPPENLQGIISMPNGITAGFKDNEVWFSEPYYPHAWPPGNIQTTDFPIVGLGLTNGALVVCTAATPYVISGNNPANMSSVKCSEPNPCNSRASILSGDIAVSYMSPNGLIQVTSSGQATNTTDLWFTREDWDQLTPQRYGRAIYLASCYFCFGSTSPLGVVPSDNSQAQTGFTIELDQDNTSFTIWPQPGGHRLGCNELTTPGGYNIDNVLNDPWTGIGYLIQNAQVYYYDFKDPQPVMTPYSWTSKTYVQNTRKSYEAMRVFFDVPLGTPSPFATVPVTPRNEAPANDPSWNTLGPNQYGIIKTFVDIGTDQYGNLDGSFVCVDAREIRKSGELLRLVDGFKANRWKWQVLGRVPIAHVKIATSVKELANV